MKTIGPYQVLQQLGSSAAGFTYRVFDTALRSELAVKELSSTNTTPSAKSKFCAKLAGCAALRHPNLANICDSGEADGAVYIATTFVEGINANHADARAFSLELKLRLVAQLAEGLAHAHGKGIAHGNLKPTNILFAGGKDALVLDMGTGDWQALILASGERLPGLIPNYLSPEQILGQQFDARSDIFSLAMVLYELIAGQHPFPVPASLIIREIIHAEPPSLRSLNPEVPESLDQLIQSAMMKNPFQRLQTADEFAAGLYAIAQQIRLMAAEQVPVCSEPVSAPVALGDVEVSVAPTAPEVSPEVSVDPAPVPVPAVAVAPSPVPPPPPIAEPPAQPAVPKKPKLAAAAAGKSNRLRNSVIAITVAGLFAIAVVEVFFTRQSLHASPPKTQSRETITRPSEPEVARPVENPAPAPRATPSPEVQPSPEAAKPAPHPEAVFRNQVRQLWEAGKYAQAMQVVNTLLAADPENVEGKNWKKKIHAAQVAEAEMK
jgi:eukaryotic-like serine/threonine-protein kinase